MSRRFLELNELCTPFLFHKGYDPYEVQSDDEEETAGGAQTLASPTLSGVRSTRRAAEETATPSAPKEIAPERLDAFKSSLLKLLKEVRNEVSQIQSDENKVLSVSSLQSVPSSRPGLG